jgi:hypothetical protein
MKHCRVDLWWQRYLHVLAVHLDGQQISSRLILLAALPPLSSNREVFARSEQHVRQNAALEFLGHVCATLAARFSKD